MSHRRAFLVSLMVTSLSLAGCTQLIDDVSGRPSNAWALEMIGLGTPVTQALTGTGVRVAVVDTGISSTHAAFDGMPGALLWGDVVNGRPCCYDDAGHGTHVSGIVVAQGTGGLQAPLVEGVAPGASLIHIKAIPGGSSGQGSDGDVGRAVDQAVKKGAHVLVLSLGSQPGLLPIGSQTENAVERAIDRGVVVVAAAGNAEEGESGQNCTVTSPGNMRRVIAVGAVDRDGKIASFSCTGDNSGGPLGLMQPEDPHRKPELVAPGVQIIGAWPSRACGDQVSDYCVLSGTSQAAPYVGGVVALFLEAHPDMKRQDADTVVEIKEALTRSAEKVWGGTGHHDRYGYGLVRADRALDQMR